MVVNIQINFGANLQVRFDQTIDAPVTPAVLDAALTDFLKDLGNARRRPQLG